MKRQHVWMGLLCATLAGCSNPLACTTEKRTLDVLWDSPFRDAVRQQVTNLENEGWACDAEPLRNPFGNSLGTRYICTICR